MEPPPPPPSTQSCRASFNIQTRGQEPPSSPCLPPSYSFSKCFAPLVYGPFFLYAALRPLFRPFCNIFVKSHLLIFSWNRRNLQKCFNFSTLGYQANIDSSDTHGAMNYQMWGISSGSPGSLVHVSIQEIPFLAYM